MFITIEQNTNFKQNIQKNRLKIKELLERKIGEKKKQNRLIPRTGSVVQIEHKNEGVL